MWWCWRMMKTTFCHLLADLCDVSSDWQDNFRKKCSQQTRMTLQKNRRWKLFIRNMIINYMIIMSWNDIYLFILFSFSRKPWENLQHVLKWEVQRYRWVEIQRHISNISNCQRVMDIVRIFLTSWAVWGVVERFIINSFCFCQKTHSQDDFKLEDLKKLEASMCIYRWFLYNQTLIIVYLSQCSYAFLTVIKNILTYNKDFPFDVQPVPLR